MCNIDKTDKHLCCSCGICEGICNKDAITMTKNEFGFFVPEVDQEKCNNCGLCYSVCPGDKIKDNYIYINNYPFINTDNIKILGEHNMENVMVAILMCLCYKVPIDIIIDSLKTFKAVEHRIEYVATKKGVDYYNDSKGTNTDATIKAIKAMKKPIYLIVGGYDKNADFLPMIKEFKDKVIKAVIIGQVKERLAKDCKNSNFNNYVIKESFLDAINYCYENAKSGECVLLSPACASFDMFKDYEERGNIFKRYVKDLKE